VPLVRRASARLKVPADCRDLAVLAAGLHGVLHKVAELRPGTLVDIVEKTDAIRRPQRFAQLLQVCVADYYGRGGEKTDYPAPARWQEILAAVNRVDAGAIAAACPTAAEIPARLRAARVLAVRTWLSEQGLD